MGIIERDKDSHKAQAIDGIVKNKFKWVWLEKTLKVNVGGGFKEFPLHSQTARLRGRAGPRHRRPPGA